MSTPHDYYEFGPHDHPHMHNRGEAAPYLEPDWFANHHDGALPTLSTIGRGPQGFGLTIEKDNANLIVSSEDPMQEPVSWHVGDWSIWATQDANSEIKEGQNTSFDLNISDGVTTQTKKIIVPCGSQGSRTFCISETPAWKSNMTYQFDIDQLVSFTEENTATTHIPVPRVGDIAVFVAIKNGKPIVCYAPIEHVGTVGSSIDDYVVAVVETTYSFDGLVNYAALTDKPKINGVELIGNKTTQDLGLAGSYSDLASKPSINNVELVGNKTASDLGLPTSYWDLPEAPSIITDGNIAPYLSFASTTVSQMFGIQTDQRHLAVNDLCFAVYHLELTPNDSWRAVANMIITGINASLPVLRFIDYTTQSPVKPNYVLVDSHIAKQGRGWNGVLRYKKSAGTIDFSVPAFFELESTPDIVATGNENLVADIIAVFEI